MRVRAPVSGGPGGEQRFVQGGPSSLPVRALAAGLEHGFDDDGIHDTHKDRGWPSSHVSVAPRCQVALRTDRSIEGEVRMLAPCSRGAWTLGDLPPRRVLLPLPAWGLPP